MHEDALHRMFLIVYECTMDNSETIECQRCGRCCLADFRAYVTDDDIQRWKREQRRDILHILTGESTFWQGDRLVSADSGKPRRGCPFFDFDAEQFGCAIYDTRPAACRKYAAGSSELCPQYRGKAPVDDSRHSKEGGSGS